MRSLLLLCLLSTVAGAQQPGRLSAQADPPASAAPPDEPEWARSPPPAVGPAEPTSERARRYSRFSAGPGGPALVVVEVILGLAGGGMLGSAHDSAGETNNLYTGAMLGGLTLGTAGTVYQYFLPVQRRESVLTTFAALAGLAGGIGFANNQDLSDRDRATAALLSSQLGVFTSLLLTSGGEDISGADLGLIGISALYSTLIAGLIELINDAESTRGYNFAPMLLAPAVGMAIGGLLSVPVEMNGLGFALITSVPASLSGMALALAAPLSSWATTGRVVLITLCSTLALTATVTAFTYTPPPQERYSASSSVQITPMPVVMPAGRDGSGLAAGPGLWARF